MRDKHTSPTIMHDETKSIEQAMRRAVRHALLTHKRAGNTVAAWKDGRVVLVKSDNIQTEELAKGGRK
ncbi:MAG TPA: hypothetical protein VEZ40_01800 [Pyrinomonadaceae bacterium]|nr:hypothetical protein [Pyrinomonadaceae bacterium]